MVHRAQIASNVRKILYFTVIGAENARNLQFYVPIKVLNHLNRIFSHFLVALNTTTGLAHQLVEFAVISKKNNC